MVLLTIILFSFYGVLHVNMVHYDYEAPQPVTVQECCEDGRSRGLRRGECIMIYLTSTSRNCWIAQEQCCEAAVERSLCDNGIMMAQGQGACEMPFFQGEPWQTKISKMCCDCCTLGETKARDGSGCDFHGLLLKAQCLETATACCINCTEAVTDKPQVNLTTEPPHGPDNCIGSPCAHLCKDNGTCACFDGYQLQTDQVNCEDINECLVGSHNCFGGMICINTEGSFRCQRKISCGTGYELRDDNTCHDIDECALEISDCGSDFFCVNTPGSYRCHPKDTCPVGFIQDAVGNCNDINECVVNASPCMSGQTCVNTEGSYFCRSNTVTCGRGYHLSADGTHCQDVDECRLGNVCGNHGCFNLVGTYRCECADGFIFNSITKLCEDINECMYYHGLCAHNCENTEGSYQCSCNAGFTLSYDGKNCEDLDECRAKPCSQDCTNVYGSYYCSCHRGYQLSNINGIRCEDIDECALSTGGPVCSYSCSNVPGSFYCTCPSTGYTLAPNGRTCQDIDECAAGAHTCIPAESCFNVQGGFRCLSFTCPANFREVARGSTNDPSVSLRCIKSCRPQDIRCHRDPIHLITHTTLSLVTFRNLFEPEDLILLQTITTAKPAPQRGAMDVFFDIMAADDQFSFDVQKRSHQGMIVGVVRQVKPIIGPMEFVLEVAINYVKSGVISHCNIVIIHVFISDPSI